MEDKEETIILKTKPSPLVIITGILGTLLFGPFTYFLMSSLLTSNYTVTENGKIVTGNSNYFGLTITWIFVGILFAITAYCIWSIIGLRTIVLTNKNFILKRPFLSLRTITPLNEIESITAGTYKAKALLPNDWINTTTLYTGEKIIIELKNSKRIELRSENFSDFKKLDKAFRKMRETKIIN